MNPEKQPSQPEKSPDLTASAERRQDIEARNEQLERVGERLSKKQPEQAETARHEIEQMPADTESSPKIKQSGNYSPYARSAAKHASYQSTLKQIQQKLPTKRSRAFSRIIHQPVIESVSEVASKTVFRPSVTLGAGLGAFLGGSIIYFVARHYGFTLSGSEFILAGVAGAGIGIVMELLSTVGRRLLKRS